VHLQLYVVAVFLIVILGVVQDPGVVTKESAESKQNNNQL
jgi:uncharacterized membrane protein